MLFSFASPFKYPGSTLYNGAIAKPPSCEVNNLGMSDGTAQSLVFFAVLRGVGHRPTIAYLVRCPNQSSAPTNALDVSYTIVDQFDIRTAVLDQW
jgi:hypothetical protein